MDRNAAPPLLPAPPLPRQKLLALGNAETELIGIFHRDREQTLAAVLRKFNELIQAEVSALFLVPEDSPGVLEYVCDFPPFYEPPARQRMKIRAEPGGGLTSAAAALGGVLCLRGERLHANPYVARRPVDYLPSGECYSVLFIPLKDRKGRVIGLLKGNNKKGPDGVASDDVGFTDEDISVATILANTAALVLENLRTFESVQGLMGVMHDAPSLSWMLQMILEASCRLLRADRGDLAVLDTKGALVMACQRGDSPPVQPGEAIPTPSIMRRVWHTQRPCLAPSVTAPEFERVYHCFDARTQSEVAVLLHWERKPIGVLNCESFALDGFDAQDVQALQLLGQFAVIAYHTVGKERHFRDIVQLVASSPPSRDFLTGILEYLRGIYDCDGGIIYIADYNRSVLSCEAYVSRERVGLESPSDFSYAFDEPSLANQILRTKEGYFSPDPWADGNFNQKGLELFHIRGPLVGVPLLYGERVVGVLILWSNRPGVLTAKHKVGLEPFAALAASSIALTAEQTAEARAIDCILLGMGIRPNSQAEPPPDEGLKLILQGLHLLGFDRVRLFSYSDAARCFLGSDSLGMDDGERFPGLAVSVDYNPYARHTYENRLIDITARIYDPKQFGPDPDAGALGKPADLPWAVVPLLFGGELFGQIVVDNAHSRQAITPRALRYLTLLGAFAALLLAKRKALNFLSWQHLPALYARVDANVPRPVILRRFLVYLTCGEGLSFNRALFLERDPERRQLVYRAGMGLGSVDPARFLTVADAAREEGIEHILDRAGDLTDEDFDAHLRDFAVDVDDPDAGALLADTHPLMFQPAPPGRWPAWAAALAERIDTREFLAVAVRANAESGVFIVDRRYRQMPLDEATRTALRTFAQLAGHILGKHTLIAQMVSKETEAWQRLSFSTAHKLGNPLFAIETNLDTLECALAENDRAYAAELLEKIKVSIGNAKVLIDRFKSLARARDCRPAPVLLAPLLDASCEVARSHAITCTVRCAPPGLTLYCDARRLAECFDELVANAMYWLGQQAGPGRIDIEAAPAEPAAVKSRGLVPNRAYARVRFADNGPGVPAALKARIFDPFVTSRQEGTGLGLASVRWAIEGQGGWVAECGPPGGGAEFEIFLPLVAGGDAPAARPAEE